MHEKTLKLSSKYLIVGHLEAAPQHHSLTRVAFLTIIRAPGRVALAAESHFNHVPSRRLDNDARATLCERTGGWLRSSQVSWSHLRPRMEAGLLNHAC